jgi:hypothetical protein
LATGTTLLEGCVRHLGRWVQWLFVAYLLVWSYLVAMALMSACGVAATAMFPVFADNQTGKIVFGVLHSLVAVALVIWGGYKLFEKVMGVCIAAMFSIVVVTAAALRPPLEGIAWGLLAPTVPDWRGDGLQWTLALLGGVGGTVTVLCYGYWIREEGRSGTADLNLCRLDLAMGYLMTAVFGLSMVVIGSQLGEVGGSGALLIVNIASTLQATFGGLGLAARWAFLLGAWAAFFSSLLGVWQSVPYLFTDLWGMMRSSAGPSETLAVEVDAKSLPYRAYLLGMAVVPISGLLLFDFRGAVRVYAFVGAFFIPMLAAVLLALNGNANLVGAKWRNTKLVTSLLVATLVVFLIVGGMEIRKVFR